MLASRRYEPSSLREASPTAQQYAGRGLKLLLLRWTVKAESADSDRLAAVVIAASTDGWLDHIQYPGMRATSLAEAHVRQSVTKSPICRTRHSC